MLLPAESKRSAGASRQIIAQAVDRLHAAVDARARLLLDSVALLEKQKRTEFEERRMSTALGISSCALVKEHVSRAVKLPDLEVTRAKAAVDVSLRTATEAAAELKGALFSFFHLVLISLCLLSSTSVSRRCSCSIYR
jgi:hypothetical protein